MNFINLLNQGEIQSGTVREPQRKGIYLKPHRYFSLKDYTFVDDGTVSQIENVAVGFDPEKKEVVIRQDALQGKEFPVDFRENLSVSSEINGKDKKFDGDILLLVDQMAFPVGSLAYMSILQFSGASLILLHAGTVEVKLGDEYIPLTRSGKIPVDSVQRYKCSAESFNQYCLYTDPESLVNMAPESVIGVVASVKLTREKIRDSVKNNEKITAPAKYSEFPSFKVKVVKDESLGKRRNIEDGSEEYQVLDYTYRNEVREALSNNKEEIEKRRERNRIADAKLKEADRLRAEKELEDKKEKETKKRSTKKVVAPKIEESESDERGYDLTAKYFAELLNKAKN